MCVCFEASACFKGVPYNMLVYQGIYRQMRLFLSSFSKRVPQGHGGTNDSSGTGDLRHDLPNHLLFRSRRSVHMSDVPQSGSVTVALNNNVWVGLNRDRFKKRVWNQISGIRSVSWRILNMTCSVPGEQDMLFPSSAVSNAWLGGDYMHIGRQWYNIMHIVI